MLTRQQQLKSGLFAASACSAQQQASSNLTSNSSTWKFRISVSSNQKPIHLFHTDDLGMRCQLTEPIKIPIWLGPTAQKSLLGILKLSMRLLWVNSPVRSFGWRLISRTDALWRRDVSFSCILFHSPIERGIFLSFGCLIVFDSFLQSWVIFRPPSLGCIVRDDPVVWLTSISLHRKSCSTRHHYRCWWNSRWFGYLVLNTFSRCYRSTCHLIHWTIS